VSGIYVSPDAVRAVQREVLRHQISVADQVVLLNGERAEIVLDGAKDALEALASLRSHCMIHQILRDQVVEHRWVAALLPSMHFLDDLFRGGLIHVTRRSSMTGQVSWSASLALTHQVGTRHSFGVPRWPLD
jgi:hypothetical protein